MTERSPGFSIGAVLFNLFINDPDDEIEYILSKFDTMLGRSSDLLGVRKAL